jgi:hypothetical protein
LTLSRSDRVACFAQQAQAIFGENAMVEVAGGIMAEEAEERTSRYSTFVSIMLAVVSVIGAIVAWRVSVALSDAGSSDTAGLLAEMDKADVEIQATISVIGHKTVYASFVTDKSIADGFYALGDNYTYLAYAFHNAANEVLNFIPRNYLDRDENFDYQRDLGETIANSELSRDTNAQPYFDAADRARVKGQWLLVDLIFLGAALLFLTLADAIQNFTRHLFLALGLLILVTGSLAVVALELIL